MNKLLYLFVMVMLLNGCVTTSSITPKLTLGMTKQEVLAKCGNPLQAGAVKGSDGRTYETFQYKEVDFFYGDRKSVTTYVYFADGKVIYYGGNPNMPTDEKSSNQQFQK